MFFSTIKWLHILAAIVALGANITYIVWLQRASRSPDHLVFALRGIKFLDDILANPAYVILFLTGIAMVYLAKLDITTPWILTSLVGLILVAITGLGGYSPTLRRQIMAAENEGPDSAAYATVSRHSYILGGLIILMVIGITYLMAVKPHLWG